MMLQSPPLAHNHAQLSTLTGHPETVSHNQAPVVLSTSPHQGPPTPQAAGYYGGLE